VASSTSIAFCHAVWYTNFVCSQTYGLFAPCQMWFVNYLLVLSKKHHLQCASAICQLSFFRFAGYCTWITMRSASLFFLSFRTIGLVASNQTMYGHHHQTKLQDHLVLCLFLVFFISELSKLMSSSHDPASHFDKRKKCN
jgi:hypothetical protein